LTGTSRSDEAGIERNVHIHDRIAGSYDRRHGEIFTAHEQQRLRAALQHALAGVSASRNVKLALDFGCGSGNLTRHLLDLGCRVTAADVSPGFLKLVTGRYPGAPLETHQLNGIDLADFADDSFDFVAAYSVLHHIPDYLRAVSEMGRVTKPGGVVFIDHEMNPSFWQGDEVYQEFLARARKPDLRKFLVPGNYVGKFRRLFDPRYTNEGDILVWPDHHIEWDRIVQVLFRHGFEPFLEQDYLVFRSNYRPNVFEEYQSRCTDMRMMAFRTGKI
jgi:SAM-dependent methyltransferase